MTFPEPNRQPERRPGLKGVLVGIVVVAMAAGLAFAVRPLLQPVAEPGVVAPSASPASPAVAAAPSEPPRASPPARQRKPRTRRTPRPRQTQPRAEVALPPVEAQLRPFAGLSTWIDIYDTDLTSAEQIARAAAGGVELIFVQSARHKSPTDIQDAKRLGEVLELAHDRGMQVMVWYVPDFVRERRDHRRSMAAIAFQSPRGDRPDAFGLDIEIEDQTDIALRTQRLLGLSKALREWVGPNYPMAAIVLPPLQLELRQDWWPNFPYAQIRPYYDVFIPMSYSSYRGTDATTTYQWNAQNVQLVRQEAGDPTLPVHLAGGIADNFPQVGAFVRAVRDSNSIGGGLYDLHTTHPDAWPILRALRAQPAN